MNIEWTDAGLFDIVLLPCKVCGFITAHSHAHTAPRCAHLNHDDAELALLEHLWRQA